MDQRPSYRIFKTTVGMVTDITPRMRRVTLQGDDLAEFGSDRPGQWVKLFFGDSDDGRAFTIRHWRPDEREIVIDFVRHSHGLAASWVAGAQPGMPVRLAGPRSDFRHRPERQLILFGDETAIPAISAITEALPPDGRALAIIELADQSARQFVKSCGHVEWRWLVNETREPGLALTTHCQFVEAAPETSQIWIGCEAKTARNLRCNFGQLGFDRTALHASGYWKIGAAEHVDHESDY
jgi:NADPH-dependent ferric siderophore reductase